MVALSELLVKRIANVNVWTTFLVKIAKKSKSRIQKQHQKLRQQHRLKRNVSTILNLILSTEDFRVKGSFY
jgi:predicted ATP-grasp superfamily ATP-dependent carboligase